MIRRFRTTFLIILALLFTVGESVEAQAFGRVTVLVKNEDGKPVQGVKVTVTSKELGSFEEVKETNKKGRAIFSFTDATKIYDFRFEYEGFPPLDVPIKPEVKGSITREITLSKGQPAAAADDGAITTVFTPSEKVFNEGVKALQDGDMDTALTKFLEAVEKNEKMALAHSALAGVYLEKADYASALASVTRYLELEPDNPRGIRMLYEAHNKLGNEKEAEEALKALKKLDQGGDTVAMIFNEGVAAVRVGDYKNAKARFEEALQLDPNLSQAVGALAVIYINEKNFAEAARMAEKHLELQPGDVKSLRIRWDAYRGLGDAAKAEEAFKDLAAADPKVLISDLYNKGNELFDGGDVTAAKEYFEKVLEIDPTYARAHYRLGVSHVSAGESADAKEHLQRFIDLAPDDPEAAVAKDMLQYLN